MSPKIKIIVAFSNTNNGIGIKGELPWDLSTDRKFFSTVTSYTKDPKKINAVIMGRKTYFSIPVMYRPLKNRKNFILSNTVDTEEEITICSSLDNAINIIKECNFIENIFIIGGQTVYEEVMKRNLADELYVTEIYKDFDCDTFFPKIDETLYKKKSILGFNSMNYENGIEFKFFKYKFVGKVHEECQYLELIKKVINQGNFKGDRTGTGTLSLFGEKMRFSLRDNIIPLLTTKRTFWRGVVEELLWFIKGDTNANNLQKKGIHIWDGNGSRNFLDNLGFTDREEGDLGPLYGWQWRHFGAEYKTMNDDYTGQGVDQLQNLINIIKTNPNDRRMILSAWNPASQHKMVLPACHVMSQFYVYNGELSCQMYQRSADMGLGVPFNIASYSLLTCILAHCTGLKPGEFIHIIGDCHVYSNHIEPLKEQLKREPKNFPTLKINTDNTNIDNFKYEDFVLENYKPHKTIKMKMAV